MTRAPRLLIALATAVVMTPAAAEATSEATLRGSRGSMIRQNAIASENDYTFLRSASQVRDFVEEGFLFEMQSNDDYALANVSYPYARAELKLFVERLAAQYREGCGERLVITSLTRPSNEQPGNAHALSVHPAGMAVDLRVSQRQSCRAWLEGSLLSLEAKGLLDITREFRPPHYHVAIFPVAYAEYAAVQIAADSARMAAEKARSDSLAAIAARNTPTDLMQAPAAQTSRTAGLDGLPVSLIAMGLLTLSLAGNALRRRVATIRRMIR